MSESSLLDPNIIKKNSNNFSTVGTMLSLTNNTQFRNGERDFYNHKYVTETSYLWHALSAISEELGEVLYEKTLNYIEDICDIDTCSVKSLQSMVSILGTDFSLFRVLEDCPLELLKIIDVLSIRKDYLINSSKVCEQLAAQISSKTLMSNDIELTTIYGNDVPKNATIYPSIDSDKLDNLISATYREVLDRNIEAKFNMPITDEPQDNPCIYQILSNEILNNGFALPNKYADRIYRDKLRYNISPEFDVEHEYDKIDAGISSLTSYSTYEQEILKIEKQRRTEPRDELSPISKYSYYKAAKVRDYFKFVEKQYVNSTSSYMHSNRYDFDPTYLSVDNLASPPQLLTRIVNNTGNTESYTLQLDGNMIKSVAIQLLEITKTIRNIRQYLKSHAQRIYMKGAFLLLSYVVNEYLVSNIYPTLEEFGATDLNKYPASTNQLKLIEYIDQSQYFNLSTDIKEDRDIKGLNTSFTHGNSTHGNSDLIDTTNIFRKEIKAKFANMTAFDMNQIADFYINILRTPLQYDETSEIKTNLNNFLTSVFEVGADNTYYDPDFKKIMCELQPEISATKIIRKFTYDTECYLSSVSAAIDNCNFMLNLYEPEKNTTVYTQLNTLSTEYLEKCNAYYTQQMTDILGAIDTQLENQVEFTENLTAYQYQFSTVEQQFATVMSEFAQYTGVVDLTSNTLESKIEEYKTKVESATDYAIARLISSRCAVLQTALANVKTALKRYVAIDGRTISCNCILSPFATTFKYDPISSNMAIRWNTTVATELSTITVTGQFEAQYSIIENTLATLYTSTLEGKLQIQNELNRQIATYISTVQITEYNQLNSLLEAHYADVFNIKDAYQKLAIKLDYTNSEWYKYKTQLFKKYTGLDLGNTPYYNSENQRHPSYQIHPCLSNFMEYVDYTYPIKDLAGITESTIDQIVNQSLENLVNSDGYLLSVWNNPLNSNGDYLTRYEKANHIDETNSANKYFGYDGYMHPDAWNKFTNSSITWQNISSEYRGLDLTQQDLSELSDQWTDIHNNCKSSPKNILKYGLDAYGNSYILTEQRNNAKNKFFIRLKNHPYPRLAHEQFTIENSTLNNVLSDSNIEIQDFIFSKDRNVLLITYEDKTGAISTIIGSPVYEHIFNDTEDYHRLMFKPVTQNAQVITDLNSNMPNITRFESFYTCGRYIGVIYSAWSGNTLSLHVRRFAKDDTSGQPTDLSVEISSVNNGYKLDCQSNGDIAIATIESNITQFKSDILSDTWASNKLLSRVTNIDGTVQIRVFTPTGNSFIEKSKNKFKPSSNLGLIPVIPKNIVTLISSDSLSSKFDSGKAIGFELFSASINDGIDFKFIIPASIEENYTLCADTILYHRSKLSTIPKPQLYLYNNIRYGESYLNLYVFGNNDAPYMDYTEAERMTYISSDSTQEFFNYQELVRYEVTQYLSAFRSEDETSYTNAITDIFTDGTSLQDYVNHTTQFYLVPASATSAINPSNAIISTYLSGYTTTRINGIDVTNTGILKIDDDHNPISVNWIEWNNKQYVKLDFNISAYNSGNLFNQYNHKHLFLNLDKPGDAGYLYVQPTNDNSSLLKLFIKNISEPGNPKFVIKKIVEADSKTQNNSAVIPASLTQNSVTLLKTEEFDSRYIIYE